MKKEFDFTDCPACGCNPVEIETSLTLENCFWDGDVVTCPECGHKGVFSCDGESEGYVDWEDKEEETDSFGPDLDTDWTDFDE